MSDSVDPTHGGTLPEMGQLDRDPLIHHVEFRTDGVIEVTLSEAGQLGERAAMSKLITIHPDLLDSEDVNDVLDTITDWTDLAWREIREG